MTEIYHITSIRNLANILRDGGLWCDRIVNQKNLAHVSIAHRHIKERRARKIVPCAPGGCLADYVPFYFAPRSPMLYAIKRGMVANYDEGQTPILHLVSSVEAVQAGGIPYVFTDGHAEMDISQFYSNVKDLDKVDWEIMKARYWNDTVDDNDRKRRRQAEFLVQRYFPFSWFSTIGVIHAAMKDEVEGLLAAVEVKPIVRIAPSWYY